DTSLRTASNRLRTESETSCAPRSMPRPTLSSFSPICSATPGCCARPTPTARDSQSTTTARLANAVTTTLERIRLAPLRPLDKIGAYHMPGGQTCQDGLKNGDTHVCPRGRPRGALFTTAWPPLAP